ncbi:hypothetical protein ACUTAF_15165 [Pseudomonas sp. SP16.1]|uniref:hypothetical protein n=1 Tax=Pseudomonas sp. SP16.1 TaxID=3458854 RepID=UPI00404555F8
MVQQIDLVIRGDYLQAFAADHKPKLCPELLDYLLDEASYHSQLSLQIHCPEAERERLPRAIGNSCSHRIGQLKRDIRAWRLLALLLMALAVGLVILATWLEVEGTIPLGIITVTAWMLVWRTSEILLLDIRGGYRDIRRYQRLIDAPKQFL